MNSVINVSIEKSQVPILWVDTSLISKTAALKLRLLKNPLEIERCEKLFDVISRKVRENKLLCPQGDQEEEIQEFAPAGCDYKQFLLKCHEIIVGLSLGSSFVHRKTIESFQRQRMMSAYLNKHDEISFNCSGLITEKSIVEFLGGKLIVSVPPAGIVEEIDSKRDKKKANCDELEGNRRTNIQSHVSFSEQLEKEYRGVIEYFIIAISEFQRTGDIIKIYQLMEILGEWERRTKKVNDIEGLLQFILSEYYRAMPSVEIMCKLYANILTGNQIIESGDMMDISQLSAVLPYCNYLLADRKMKNRIIELGFNEKYHLEVFCMRDYATFLCMLEKL